MTASPSFVDRPMGRPSSSGRDVRERLYNFSMLMFDDLPWARKRLPELRRLQHAPDPATARLYRQDADALERAIKATEADLRDLEEELRR